MAPHSSTLALENPMDGGTWWAAVHGVTKSRTRLNDFTFTFHFHALEKEMATHSSVLAWRVPGTGEPGGLPSMGLRRVGHDWSDLATIDIWSGCPVCPPLIWLWTHEEHQESYTPSSFFTFVCCLFPLVSPIPYFQPLNSSLLPHPLSLCSISFSFREKNNKEKIRE